MKLRTTLSFLILAAGAIAMVRADSPAAPRVSVLIVGGGTSHDFNRWWKEEDAKTLSAATGPVLFSVTYTDNPAEAAKLLGDADALLLAVNQKGFSDPAVREALAKRVEAGKGIGLLHAGVWYNYKDWPEYNRLYVGGGAKSHDHPEEFEVTVTEPEHPLMKGLPAKFKITDELYHMVPDPKGTPIEVLATATSPLDGKTWPSIWIVKNPKCRIAAIALGHDGRAHDNPAYKTLLVNEAAWVAGK